MMPHACERTIQNECECWVGMMMADGKLEEAKFGADDVVCLFG